VALTITVDGTDVTSLVRLDQITFEMKAYGGEVGAGRLVFDDTTGTATPASAMKEWVATESDASPTTIAGGFIAERDIFRGPLRAGTMRQFGPVLEDYNAALADRILMGATARRPQETDYQRITWLLGMGALGHLDGAGHVPNTDTVTMEDANYRGKYALDVLQECAEAANKNHFVYWKQGTGWVLFYDKTNATNSAFTSTLQISDLLSDVDNSTVFAASDIEYQRDPVSIFSSMVVRWKSGWIREHNDDTKDDFRQRDIFRRRTRCRTASAARRWARKQLEKTDEETQRLTLTVTVPGSKLGELRAGQRIEVKLRHVGITSFTYFRIVAVAISPKIGQGGNATDVLYSVRLTMRDKERLLGGGVGGGTRVGSGGNSGVTGPPGGGGGGAGDGGNDGGEEEDDDPSPPGGGVDSGEYILDDWTRAGGGTVPVEIERQVTVSSGTSHVVALTGLPGLDVGSPTRWLVLGYSTTDPDASADLLAQFQDLGFFSIQDQQSVGTLSAAVMVQALDGTQSYEPEDNTLTVTTPGSETLIAFASIIEGVSQWSGGELVAQTTPSVSGWAGEDEWLYGFGFSDAAITGWAALEDQASGGAALRVAGGAVVGAQNPPDWTMTGTSKYSVTIVGRYSPPGWGNILRGEGVDTQAPWVGGNPYIAVASGTATPTVDGTHGILTIGADGSVIAMVLSSDSPDSPTGYPWGPWTDGDGALRYLWKVDPAGDVTDAAENLLEWQIVTGGWQAFFRVNLGDVGTPTQQIQIVQQDSESEVSPAIPVTIMDDTYYQTRIDFRGTRVRMKFWEDGTTEPIDWMIDEAKIDDDDATPQDVGQLYLRARGNNGMVFTFDTSWAQVSGGTTGTTTEELPRGDGVTVTWTVLPWVGELQAFVDGLGPVLVTTDRVAGTFTFDRAPALGAWISVRYVQA
jgi:hypothetical protein